jgi:hypothetical protein
MIPTDSFRLRCQCVKDTKRLVSPVLILKTTHSKTIASKAHRESSVITHFPPLVAGDLIQVGEKKRDHADHEKTFLSAFDTDLRT